MIKLYHGSNVNIDSIDISKGHKGKDFGKGFYLSENIEQATAMAKLVTARIGDGVPTLIKNRHFSAKTIRFDGKWVRNRHFRAKTVIPNTTSACCV